LQSRRLLVSGVKATCNRWSKPSESFSRASAEKGIRESFSEFIADDGILFSSHRRARKKVDAGTSLAAVIDSSAADAWQPNVAGISQGRRHVATPPVHGSGKNDIKDAKPARFRKFHDRVEEAGDGKWRFVIDLGITNPEPKNPIGTWHGPLVSRSARFPASISCGARRSAHHRRNFSKASAEQGAVSAFSPVRRRGCAGLSQ
jgi:hypothetical protein